MPMLKGYDPYRSRVDPGASLPSLNASGSILALDLRMRRARTLHQSLGSNGRKELEGSASVEIAKHTLISAGLILGIGTITGLIAQKIRIPDVAVFLVVGMLK